MTKLAELKTATEIAAEELLDPEIRRKHERQRWRTPSRCGSSATESTAASRRPGLLPFSACTSPRSRGWKQETTSHR